MLTNLTRPEVVAATSNHHLVEMIRGLHKITAGKYGHYYYDCVGDVIAIIIITVVTVIIIVAIVAIVVAVVVVVVVVFCFFIVTQLILVVLYIYNGLQNVFQSLNAERFTDNVMLRSTGEVSMKHHDSIP